MKIRKGFVSNSSSSSFCIFGISFDYDKISHISNHELKEKGINLEIEGRYEDYYPLYIGLPPESMGENETKAQFRDRIYLEIEKFCKEYNLDVPEKSSINFKIDGWYDG